MILHVFLSLTGVRETVLSHLWRSGSTLGEKIKPWLFVPGFQFCIPVSCAEGMLWWDKWHWLVIKDNILHLSEWSQRFVPLCSCKNSRQQQTLCYCYHFLSPVLPTPKKICHVISWSSWCKNDTIMALKNLLLCKTSLAMKNAWPKIWS